MAAGGFDDGFCQAGCLPTGSRFFIRKAHKVYQHRNNVPVFPQLPTGSSTADLAHGLWVALIVLATRVLNVINLTDNRADPKRFFDISASIVLCIAAKIRFPDRYFLLAT